MSPSRSSVVVLALVCACGSEATVGDNPSGAGSIADPAVDAPGSSADVALTPPGSSGHAATTGRDSQSGEVDVAVPGSVSDAHDGSEGDDGIAGDATPDTQAEDGGRRGEPAAVSPVDEASSLAPEMPPAGEDATPGQAPPGAADSQDEPAISNNPMGTMNESPSAPGGMPREQELAPIPNARGEHGVVALNGEVYVMCGFTPSVTSNMHRYSPDEDRWRRAADVPVVCHHPNVAAVGGRIYILGFHAGSGQRMADGRVFEYDPVEDAWQERSPLPVLTERGAACVTTFEDKVYVFGGTNDVALRDASLYDPVRDTWEELAPLPAYRHHCIAAEIGGKIYIVSGRDVVIEEVQPESYVFDPVMQTYEEVAPIPTPRGGAAGGELGGRIYVFGGEGNVEDPRGIFPDVEAYDPVTDSWARLPDMGVPRHGFGAAVIGDRIYLPGGSTRQGIEAKSVNSVFYYDLP